MPAPVETACFLPNVARARGARLRNSRAGFIELRYRLTRSNSFVPASSAPATARKSTSISAARASRAKGDLVASLGEASPLRASGVDHPPRRSRLRTGTEARENDETPEQKKGICQNERVTICQNDDSEPVKSLMRWWAHQGSNLGPD